jgi:hypothetical protein
MAEQRTGTTWQEFKVTGGQLLDTVKNLINEGNIRRIQVRQEGKTLIELPLTVVAVGVLIAPVAAAIGALAALVTECTIAVERDVEPPTTPPTDPTTSTV